MKNLILLTAVFSLLSSPSFAGRGSLKDMMFNTAKRGFSTMRTKFPRENLLEKNQRRRTYVTILTEGFRPDQTEPMFYYEALPKK